MEVRARFALMGAFALAALALGFAFVYWLQAPGRVGQRAVYRIHFAGSVAGLMKGSAVLFNGIRAGEVTALTLDPAEPNGVVVQIAVDRATPVRADTVVGIDFQGLTGAPVVTLSGGTATLPLLASLGREPPILQVDKNAGQSMTQTATMVLRHLDDVINDNAAPFKSVIANVNTFSEALSRNSSKVDGIVAGLERMTGGGAKIQPRIVDLPAAKAFPGLKTRPTVQLVVPEPTALTAYDGERIVIHGAEAEKPTLEGAQWPDTLSKVVQARLLQSFENAQYLLASSHSAEGFKADFQLQIDIRAFHIQTGPSPSADAELSLKIANPDGRIIAARIFTASTPIASFEPQVVAKGLGDSFEKIAAEIVVWTCATL